MLLRSYVVTFLRCTQTHTQTHTCSHSHSHSHKGQRTSQPQQLPTSTRTRNSFDKAQKTLSKLRTMPREVSPWGCSPPYPRIRVNASRCPDSVKAIVTKKKLSGDSRHDSRRTTYRSRHGSIRSLCRRTPSLRRSRQLIRVKRRVCKPLFALMCT